MQWNTGGGYLVLRDTVEDDRCSKLGGGQLLWDLSSGCHLFSGMKGSCSRIKVEKSQWDPLPPLRRSEVGTEHVVFVPRISRDTQKSALLSHTHTCSYTIHTHPNPHFPLPHFQDDSIALFSAYSKEWNTHFNTCSYFYISLNRQFDYCRVGCALTFTSEAKFEIEAKISFRLEAKKSLISHDSLRCETPKI